MPELLLTGKLKNLCVTMKTWPLKLKPKEIVIIVTVLLADFNEHLLLNGISKEYFLFFVVWLGT